ncbi:tyrosine-type recombinase/integrase [Lysobacter yangpyeongensis]|uniref:Tyrosine-type recombinase/integrase n=1 Tax=Lysobacter yangpyeongensis TaxID=346182 RepID=A0ABW0SJL0_9GAMM
MPSHNASNERAKRRYFAFLKEAKRHGEDTVDAAAMALARFEAYTGFRDFKSFHVEQAIAFKKHLANRDTGNGTLSKATLLTTFANLKRFFQWLSGQPGYRSKLTYSDAEYFNLSEKDTRIATARRPRAVPTLEQVQHVIASMPATTELERRDRAVIAFTLLTGARDGAIASAKLKHVDLAARSFFQDAREVRTKFSKSFTTFFFPVGDEVTRILVDWITHLRRELKWGNDDPLFPATRLVQGPTSQFEAAGLEPKHWSNADPIRRIFRTAFEAVDLPYFNPHSLRNVLVRLGEERCRSPEDFKAWSQNLGHEQVLTTFTSYGHVDTRRQADIVQSLRSTPSTFAQSPEDLALAVARKLLEQGLLVQGSSVESSRASSVRTSTPPPKHQAENEGCPAPHAQPN